MKTMIYSITSTLQYIFRPLYKWYNYLHRRVRRPNKHDKRNKKSRTYLGSNINLKGMEIWHKPGNNNIEKCKNNRICKEEGPIG